MVYYAATGERLVDPPPKRRKERRR
jgi:hypothetical protein